MNHGGPYPATSDSRHTSVGTAAILRFFPARLLPEPSPEALLPPQLLNANPLGIMYQLCGQRSHAGRTAGADRPVPGDGRGSALPSPTRLPFPRARPHPQNDDGKALFRRPSARADVRALQGRRPHRDTRDDHVRGPRLHFDPRADESLAEFSLSKVQMGYVFSAFALSYATFRRPDGTDDRSQGGENRAKPHRRLVVGLHDRDRRGRRIALPLATARFLFGMG